MSEINNLPLAEELMHFMLKSYDLLQANPIGSCTGRVRVNTHGFRIIYLLTRSPGHQCSMSCLTEHLQITKQQLSRLINELEDSGLAERRRYKNNRRMVMVALSEDGLSFFRQVEQAIIKDMGSHLMAEAPEDIEIIYAGISRLNRLLAAQQEGEENHYEGSTTA